MQPFLDQMIRRCVQFPGFTANAIIHGRINADIFFARQPKREIINFLHVVEFGEVMFIPRIRRFLSFICFHNAERFLLVVRCDASRIVRPTSCSS